MRLTCVSYREGGQVLSAGGGTMSVKQEQGPLGMEFRFAGKKYLGSCKVQNPHHLRTAWEGEVV